MNGEYYSTEATGIRLYLAKCTGARGVETFRHPHINPLDEIELFGFRESMAICLWFHKSYECSCDPKYLSPLTLPLLQCAIDLTRELNCSTNPLASKRERIMRLRTETEERLSNCNVIGDTHSKLFPGFLLVVSATCLALGNTEQKGSPCSIRCFYWLLALKFPN
jgi:hypothetical protein